MKSRIANERPGDVAELEAAIAYRFADRLVLDEALTHASAMALGRRRGGKAPRRSYERLEFLGDRVLGLAVAHLLIEAYPDEAEGGLTHRQSMLVCRETLADVAEEIGLRHYLQVAHGGRGSGGLANPTILADACEALVGAVFIDGGYDAAAELVRRYWEGRVAGLTSSPRDAKTMLQVWALARARELPSYTVLDSEGPAHAPVFTVEASLGGLGAATAEAGSKRAAEQAAAALLLERLERGADDA
ncbi:MAG: ribonuclease III [Geminicoccaceae bacterium]|jgi:ribonuclease-3|nr:ribonuclease III [Geminicoccaceae bacterium]